jgi:type II secretory pathway pseudopilin PulG
MKLLPRKSGFSLIEVGLSAAILGILTLVALSLWESCTRIFFLSTAREDLAAEARLCIASVSHQLRRSSTESVDIGSRTATGLSGTTVRRDAVTFLGLSNWRDKTKIDVENRQILWDQYLILYASLTSPGSLIFQTAQPPGAPFSGPASWTNFPDTPSLAAPIYSTKTLSKSVEEFKIKFDDSIGSADLTLVLAKQGSHKTNSRNIDERAEIHLIVRVEN